MCPPAVELALARTPWQSRSSDEALDAAMMSLAGVGGLLFDRIVLM
jgi:hypothetical protein